MGSNDLVIPLTAWILSVILVFSGVYLMLTKWSSPKDKKQ